MIKQLYKRHWGVCKGEDQFGAECYMVFCEDVFSPDKVMQAIASVSLAAYDGASPLERRGIVCGVVELLVHYNDSFYARSRSGEAECHPAFKKVAQ